MRRLGGGEVNETALGGEADLGTVQTLLPTAAPMTNLGHAISHQVSIGFRYIITLLFCSCAVVSLLLIVLPAGYHFYTIKRRQRRQLITARRRARLASLNGGRSSTVCHTTIETTPEQLYCNIEAWLVSKHVTEHDHVCDSVLAASSRTTTKRPYNNKQRCNTSEMLGSAYSSSNSLSTLRGKGDNNMEAAQIDDDNDCEQNECSICYEAFQVSDIADASKNVIRKFHIAGLLRNDNCPFCRKKFLPLTTNNNNDKKQIHELLLAHQNRSVPAFYCKQHGTVRPAKHLLMATTTATSENSNSLKRLQERANDTCSRNELQQLRGREIYLLRDDNNDNEEVIVVPETDDEELVHESDADDNNDEEVSSSTCCSCSAHKMESDEIVEAASTTLARRDREIDDDEELGLDRGGGAEICCLPPQTDKHNNKHEVMMIILQAVLNNGSNDESCSTDSCPSNAHQIDNSDPDEIETRDVGSNDHGSTITSFWPSDAHKKSVHDDAASASQQHQQEFEDATDEEIARQS